MMKYLTILLAFSGCALDVSPQDPVIECGGLYYYMRAVYGDECVQAEDGRVACGKGALAYVAEWSDDTHATISDAAGNPVAIVVCSCDVCVGG